MLNLVVDTLRRVEDSLGRLSENVTMQLSRLPSDYVPRREVERRLDELTFDIAGEETARVAAIKDLKDEIEKARARAVTFRHWLIGTGVTASAALGSTLINHFT